MAESVEDNLGFVKLFRKMLNWEWYKDVPVKTLFIHCLIRARHNEKRWRGLLLKQGQFPTGLTLLAKETGLSYQEIRTALKKLVSTNDITSEATTKGTIITVNNYSTYHDRKDDGNVDINKRSTNEQQTGNKRATTIKNVKNVKKVKKVKKEDIGEEELIYPECVERKLIDDYFANRIEIKKKMTHRAKELFLKKVQRLHDKGQDVTTLIETTIMRNYTDIYEQKGDGNGKNFRGRKSEPVKKAGSKSGREEKRDTIITIED